VVLYKGKCYDGPINGVDNETGDIVSIRSALFYLCRENTDTEFGSCCVNNDYGALVTFDNYPSCFGSVNVDSDGKITLNWDNIGIKSLPDAPFSLIENLTTLSMKNNNITSIPFSLSDLATNLVILDLSYNSIDDLSDVIFGNLFYLRSLSLKHNSFTSLPSDMFNSFIQLTSLDLQYNELTRIEDGYFSSIASLNYLDLSYNSISFIGTGCFPDNNNRLHLHLSHNDLTSISDSSFSNPTHMAELDLTYNTITSIPDRIITVDNDEFTRNVDYNCIECQTASGLTCDYENQNRCPGLICHHKNYISGCATCNSSEYNGVCESCHEGYHSDSSKTTCESCSDDSCCYEGNWDDALENCRECGDDGKCRLCNLGFYIGDDGKCVKCGEHTCCSGRNTEPESFNCSGCDENETACLKCLTYQVLYEGRCYSEPINVTGNVTDDVVSLRYALFDLCKENYQTKLGSCCAENANGASATFDDYPECFGSASIDDNGKISLNWDNIGIETLPIEPLKPIASLTKLSISHNKISVVPFTLVSFAPSLTVLRMRVTQIPTIKITIHVMTKNSFVFSFFLFVCLFCHCNIQKQ